MTTETTETTEEKNVQVLDKELLNDLVRQTARERALSSEEVVELIEEALARVLSRNNNRSGQFRVKINRETFALHAERLWEVIANDEPIEDIESQKTHEVAIESHPEAEIGGEIAVEAEAPDLNRHSNAQVFKQNYLNCLRQAEHSKMLDELLERGERLINGTVKRIDRSTGDYIIEVQKVECRLRRSDSIPKESLRPGDRIRCLIKEIKEDPNRGRMVMLTRSSDDFLRELFRREVPEIEKGILEVLGVARDPGYRSKIVVRSRDAKVDPVGTCVGMRGSRVQSVTADLGGEKVDIIPWEEEETAFVLGALAPAEISSMRVTGQQSCDIIVDEDKLAQAIGKSGMNVKLASRLTGWQINITNAAEAEGLELERIQRTQEYFAKHLDVDEAVSRILYDEGFNSIEDLAETEKSELLEIEGFDETTVEAILARSVEAVNKVEAEYQAKYSKCEQQLREIATDPVTLRALIINDILTVQGLADLDVDELHEFADDITDEEAQQLIMDARTALGLLDVDEEIDE